MFEECTVSFSGGRLTEFSFFFWGGGCMILHNFIYVGE